MCFIFMLCVVLFVRFSGSREVYYTEIDDLVVDSVIIMESIYIGRLRLYNRIKFYYL